MQLGKIRVNGWLTDCGDLVGQRVWSVSMLSLYDIECLGVSYAAPCHCIDTTSRVAATYIGPGTRVQS